MITYPLNNIDYTAEDAELYFSTRHSGVYDGDDDFAVTVSGIDNDVTVGSGIAWIQNTKFSGKVAALKNPKTLTLDLADSVYDRIDAIVIRFDASENSSDVIVKIGTASSVPVAPSVSRTESLYELHIYHIRRKAGATTIRVDDIIDQRKNQYYCGVIFYPISAIDETLSKRGFAADAEAVGNAIRKNSGISMTLLWENASHTSEFVAQSIALDLSGYDLVAVVPKPWNGAKINETIDFVFAKVGSKGFIQYTGNVNYLREFESTISGIAFADCMQYLSYGWDGSSQATNSSLIPLVIYGLKGVTT